MIRSAAWIEASRARRAVACLALTALATAAACSLDEQGTQPDSTTMTSSSSGGGSTTTSSTGLGGMGGGGGTGGSPPGEIAAWSGETGPGADGTYTLPSWLELNSPSTEKTAQTGPATLRTGFGAHAARARNVKSPPAWGLSLESARTNRTHNARITAASWPFVNPPGSIAATQGPDMGNLAATITDSNSAGLDGAAAAIGNVDMVANQTSTLSAWVSNVQAASQVKVASTAYVFPFGVLAPAQAGWQRVSYTAVEAANGVGKDSLYPANSSSGATGSANFDFVSHETGKYPSSAILTSGAAATRMAETLAAGAGATLVPDGYFHVTLVFAPSYASGEQASAHTLLGFGVGNAVVLEYPLNRVTLLAGGVAVLSTPALVWQRDQALTVEVVHTPTEQAINVTGDDTGGASVSGPPGVPLTPGPTITILGGASGSEECADLRSITFTNPTP